MFFLLYILRFDKLSYMANKRVSNREDLKVVKSFRTKFLNYAQRAGLEFDDWLEHITNELKTKEPENPLVN